MYLLYHIFFVLSIVFFIFFKFFWAVTSLGFSPFFILYTYYIISFFVCQHFFLFFLNFFCVGGFGISFTLCIEYNKIFLILQYTNCTNFGKIQDQSLCKIPIDKIAGAWYNRKFADFARKIGPPLYHRISCLSIDKLHKNKKMPAGLTLPTGEREGRT